MDVDDSLKATYNRKMGQWIFNNVNEKGFNEYDKVTDLLKESLRQDQNVTKTWHYLALVNYKRIQHCIDAHKRQTKEKNRRASISITEENQGLLNYITEAFSSFIKSISVGDAQSAETLQDLLRLLDILFRYGDHDQVQKIIDNEFYAIETELWLRVMPQLITRIDVSNKKIEDNVMNLLFKIAD